MKPDRYPHFVVHRACWEIYAADLDRSAHLIESERWRVVIGVPYHPQ